MATDDNITSLLASLGAVLAPHGFRRKGQTFLAERGDVLLLVTLQCRASSVQEPPSLTLNLGVYSTTLAKRAREAGQFVPPPGIWACHWQERIGHLLPGNDDQWWRLVHDGDAARVGVELREALEGYGLAALEQVASTARLRALWTTGTSPGLTDRQRQEYLALLA